MINKGKDAIRLSLGTVDWQHPEWIGSVYPDDMPEEWQLSYYGTQFRCVWLARPRWKGADHHEIRHWIEDAREDFVFLLEAEADESINAGILDLFAGRGRVLSASDSSLVWFDRSTGLAELTQRLRALPSGDYFLISKDADPGSLERVATLLGLLGH